jgi:taurine dioxygenase
MYFAAGIGRQRRRHIERTLTQVAAVREGLGQRRIGIHRAFNTSAKADVSRTWKDRVCDSGVAAAKNYATEHPVVRTHPETGRRALHVNVARTPRFAGWTEEESAPLLQYLFAHQVRPEFTCRFRWEPGSIAFWDNRAAQHNPVNDYHGHRRLMHRITLSGHRPA